MSSESRRVAIEISPHAERDLAKLPGAIARLILEEIRARLSTEPIREIKTRIKRLTGFSPPLYRLRVGDYRSLAKAAGITVGRAANALPAMAPTGDMIDSTGELKTNRTGNGAGSDLAECRIARPDPASGKETGWHSTLRETTTA